MNRLLDDPPMWLALAVVTFCFLAAFGALAVCVGSVAP